MEPRDIAQLDTLLAEHGCALVDWRLKIPVGRNRETLIAGLIRIIVARTVALVPAERAPRNARICRDCGIEILFIQSPKTQKWIPVDRRPLVLVTADGTVVRGCEAHQATCPKRNERLAREAQAQHERSA